MLFQQEILPAPGDHLNDKTFINTTPRLPCPLRALSNLSCLQCLPGQTSNETQKPGNKLTPQCLRYCKYSGPPRTTHMKLRYRYRSTWKKKVCPDICCAPLLGNPTTKRRRKYSSRATSYNSDFTVTERRGSRTFSPRSVIDAMFIFGS